MTILIDLHSTLNTIKKEILLEWSQRNPHIICREIQTYSLHEQRSNLKHIKQLMSLFRKLKIPQFIFTHPTADTQQDTYAFTTTIKRGFGTMAMWLCLDEYSKLMLGSQRLGNAGAWYCYWCKIHSLSSLFKEWHLKMHPELKLTREKERECLKFLWIIVYVQQVYGGGRVDDDDISATLLSCDDGRRDAIFSLVLLYPMLTANGCSKLVSEESNTSDISKKVSMTPAANARKENAKKLYTSIEMILNEHFIVYDDTLSKLLNTMVNSVSTDDGNRELFKESLLKRLQLELLDISVENCVERGALVMIMVILCLNVPIKHHSHLSSLFRLGFALQVISDMQCWGLEMTNIEVTTFFNFINQNVFVDDALHFDDKRLPFIPGLKIMLCENIKLMFEECLAKSLPSQSLNKQESKKRLGEHEKYLILECSPLPPEFHASADCESLFFGIMEDSM